MTGSSNWVIFLKSSGGLIELPSMNYTSFEEENHILSENVPDHLQDGDQADGN